MDSLQKRFGKLLAAHRRNLDLTQAPLADRAQVSVHTIAKLETGVAAPSFRTIEALASELQIDPAELFTAQFAGGRLQRPALRGITDQLAVLDDEQLKWLRQIIDVALSSRR